MADKEDKGKGNWKQEIEVIQYEGGQDKNHHTEQVLLDQNQKDDWESPDVRKQAILFPKNSMEREESYLNKQQDHLKTSTSQLYQSDANLFRKTQISGELTQEDNYHFMDKDLLSDEKMKILHGDKQQKFNNFKTITELSSCINNSLLNNDMASPQSQLHKSLQEDQILHSKINFNLEQTPSKERNQDEKNLIESQFPLIEKESTDNKDKQREGTLGSHEDLVSIKSSVKSDKKRKNYSEVPVKSLKKIRHSFDLGDENNQNDIQQPTQIKFIHKQKTLTEKIIDKIANIVNGSQNQIYADEDKHLKDDIILLEQQNEYLPIHQQEDNEIKVAHKNRKSIKLYAPSKKRFSSAFQSENVIEDFDQFISKGRLENVGVKRRTYTEFNSLMKQQTREYEFDSKFKKEDGQDEQDDDQQNEEKSDIDSVKGNTRIAQTEEEMQKNLNKKSKGYKRKKKVLVIDANGQFKEQTKEQEIVKYDYPFPYNQKIRENQDEEQFRHVDDDLREEYDYYSRKQNLKQEKNREQIIYASKKNEFEMLSIMADGYPLLQLRKGFLMICKFISWIAYKIIKHRYFERVVLFVIIFNTVVQCMDDPTSDTTSPTIDAINLFFLIAYTVECCLKILGLGFMLNKGSYLRDGWNILDFTIVVTSLLPYVMGADSGVQLSALRSLRVLRPLKTISKIKSLKIVLLALFSSFPYLVNAIIILIFFYLIFAIAGLQLFQGVLKKRCFDPTNGLILPGTEDQPCGGNYSCPDNYTCGKMFSNPIYGVYNFDNILSSFLMVFVCVTLESWTQIMYYVFDAFTSITVVYFVVLAFVGAFFLINLTLAVIKAKFTAPEDTGEEEEKIQDEEIIDMHRLKMFRRMERNHLRRKLLAKKNILMYGVKDLNLSDDGLYFNWEDLMKLKLQEDKRQEEQAKQEERDQIMEKQIKMKEKLKQKLHKAINKDTLFKKFKLESVKERQLPHQKIVFYVGKEQGEVISQATFNEIEHHHNHHKKIRSSSRIASKIFGLMEKQNQRSSMVARKSSIQLQHGVQEYAEKVKQQKKEMQQISFLGVQRGVMTPAKGPISQQKNEKPLTIIQSRTSFSQSNHAGSQHTNHHHHHHIKDQSQHSIPLNQNYPNNLVINEEEDEEIFERFDEINRLEQEEFKKYEKENGRVDMDEFTVINNSNLKRLRKLPEKQNNLSILSLKQPKFRKLQQNQNKNGVNNLKSILTEEDFIATTPTQYGNSSQITRDDNVESYDQISKQITKSSIKSTSDNIQQDKEGFEKLNKQLQEMHELKQSAFSASPLNTDAPLTKKESDDQMQQFENQEVTFQNNQFTQQNDEFTNGHNINGLDNGVNGQKNGEEEDQDSNKSLGIIVDHDSQDEKSKSEEASKSRKSSMNVIQKNSITKSPSATPKRKRSGYNQFKKGTYDDYPLQNIYDEANFEQKTKEQQIKSQKASKLALYYDEDDDDEEEIWVEEHQPVRPSTILKNINVHQLNLSKVKKQEDQEGEEEEEEQPQGTDRSKKADSRRSSKMYNNTIQMNSVVQLNLGKKGERVKTKEQQANEEGVNPEILALRAQLKKNAARRQSRMSIHHDKNNIGELLAQRQSQNNGQLSKDLPPSILHPHNHIAGKKELKPLQNVRHWKIMIDTMKEYKSNSSSDVLFHRLKEEQDQKIEDEQVKIRVMKYALNYRLRAMKKLSKKLIERMKKDKKKKKKDSKKKSSASKGLIRSQTVSRNQKSSAPSDSDSSYNRSYTSNLESTDLNLYITQNELFKQQIRLPIRKSIIQDQLSSSAHDTLNNDLEDQSFGSTNKIQTQMNSISGLSQSYLKQKMKNRAARKEVNKEKLVFNLENIRRVIQENIVKPQIKTSLDQVTNKSVYWDIRRIDYNLGQKNMNIWSGYNVTRSVGKNKNHTNKVLKQLCTENQDLHVWVSGLKGLISVWHKHFKNFVLSGTFNGISMACVFLNTAVLAMSGLSTEESFVDFLTTANLIFSYIFIIEMGMKIIALSPLGYVRDKINLFDGLIVSISLVEMIMFSGGSKAVSAFRAVRIFRTFRVLRVTRLLRGLEFMATIMSVVNRTIDSFMYIALLLFLFIFIYSLLGMQLYGGQLNFADNGGIRQNYDTFYYSFLSTFQIVTLENWPDILVKTMRSTVHPAITAIYLISWIFIGNYVFLNLFLAILLDGFVAEGDDEEMQRELMNMEEEGGDESDLDEQIQTTILKMNKKQIREERKKLSEEQDLMQEIKQQQALFEIDSETNLETLFEEKKVAKVKLFHGIECRDSLYMFSKTSKIRIYCYRLAQNSHFDNFILVLIIISSLKLVVDTYLSDDDQAAQDMSENIDIAFNALFAFECLVKIIAYGLFGDENSYLTDTWSQLDCFIVVASILDMSVASINLPVIKILRLLRTLRPLRFISHNVNMKVVVIALFESVGAIFNVLIVVLLIWLMFGILGISLIGDRMGYCNVPKYYGINKDTCEGMGKTWNIFPTNFDNIINSMVTLLVLSTLENWPNIMFQAQDSDTSDAGPSYEGYSVISFFYIVFILIGSFFLINLFIGVIFLKFTEAQKSQKTSIFLTEKQARWIEFQMMIIGVKAQFSQNKKPESKFRLVFWNVVTHKAFDLFVMICIIANIFTMGLSYEGASAEWDLNLQYVNYFFTAVFISEMILKILSTGFAVYLQSGWNKFDFFVVCSSIVDISMDLMGGQSLSFLRVGPQLARVVRVFRVTRLLKLVKSMKGLQKLIETLLFSLPSLVNVGALMLLFFFIFSVLGVFLFKDIEKGTQISTYNNFQNFGNAMITLFRCSTGENWQYIMFDVGNPYNCKPGGICYTQFAQIYFIFFTLVCVFVMLNLFILVLIQYFEDYHMKEDNPLDAFNENLEVFRSVWARYTAFSSGIKINHKHIVNFLSELPTPLGYLEENIEDPDERIDKHQIAKDVMEMKLPDDGFGNVFFNDCLFACMKKAYGAEIVNEGAVELKKFLIKQEYETKKKIEEKKRQILIKQKQKIFNTVKNQHVNPIVLMLFCGMAFKSWKNYLERVKDEEGAVDRDYSLTSSSSSESSFSDSNSQEENQEVNEEEQELDENGNPIIKEDNEEGDEDEEGQGQEQEVKSQSQLEDIHEKSEEDEEEEDDDKNTNKKEQQQPQSSERKERNQTPQKTTKQLTVEIPPLKDNKEQMHNPNNLTAQNTQNQHKKQNQQEVYQDVDSKQQYNFLPSKKSKTNKRNRKQQQSSSSSSSSSSSGEEKVEERAGYDENEDFAQKQERDRKWKQKELTISLKQNRLTEFDKGKADNFLQTPKYFADNEPNSYDDIDTPVHFRGKSKKQTVSKKSQYS